MEMDCLTAAVIGGVSLTGGEGKISTAVCGVLIIGVLTNGMTIMNISEYYQLVIRGCIFHEQLPYQNAITYEMEKAPYYSKCILNFPSSTQIKEDDIVYVVEQIKNVLMS